MGDDEEDEEDDEDEVDEARKLVIEKLQKLAKGLKYKADENDFEHCLRKDVSEEEEVNPLMKVFSRDCNPLKKNKENGDAKLVPEDNFSNSLKEEPIEEEKEYQDFCRICHENDNEEPLLQPCYCKGTLAKVHRSCLELWLASSHSSGCELCGQFYMTIRTPKYRCVPSFFEWLRNGDNRREVRNLVLDVMAFCVFTPMAILGTCLGLFAAENFYLAELDQQRTDITDITSARMLTVLVISLMVTVDLAYVSWLSVRMQYHAEKWYNWWLRQCTVTLLLPQEEIPPQQETT